MEVFLGALREFGPLTIATVIALAYFWDRGRAENKTENTVSDIAGNSSRELSEVHKQIGDIRQQLGMAQGQNIVLMDNLKTSEQKREAESLITKDKIFALQEKVEKQTILISRHEGRIAELETESKRKDEIIASKEHEIVDLRIENTRQKAVIETQEKRLSEQARDIQLATRAQSLDDTIQFTEAEILSLADPMDIPLIEVPNKEIPLPTETEDKKDVA